MITIVDYHCGNLGSIANMLKKLGCASEIVSHADKIMNAEKLILPGVGSFDYGMEKLAELGLIDVLTQKVIEQKTPILGVCLGAQLMCKSSEEGNLPGLGWIDAKVTKFTTNYGGRRYSVPHMGWDYVRPAKPSALFKELEESRFYFVHSYAIHCVNASDVLAVNEYGQQYHSAYERDNIVGVQFHPEKSHKFGKQVYKNFFDNY